MPYIGLAGRSVSVAVGSGVGPEALVVGAALAVGSALGAGSVDVAVAVGVAVGVSTGWMSVVTIAVGVEVAGVDSPQPASANAAATIGERVWKMRSAPQNGQRASVLRT